MENLKIVTVAPIIKSAFSDSLTYFTSKDVRPGSLVSIPIRKANVLGVITSIKQADELRSELKTSEFGLKKIDKILTNDAFLPGFVDAACETAEYFVTSAGQVIRHLTPKSILDSWKGRNGTEDDAQ